MGSLDQLDRASSQILQRGCFPISSQRSIQANQVVCSTVFGHESLEALDLSKSRGIGRIANVSWAILLRVYLRTYIVSFSLLQDGKPPVEKTIQYSLSNNEKLDEIREVDTNGSGNIEYSHIDINTAISQTKPTRSIDGIDAEVRQWQIDDMRQYLLILNVNLHRPEITVTYVCPTMSERYAEAVINLYQEIFRTVCHHGSSKLGELGNISGADRQAMISWNPQNPFESEEYQCMHHLVEDKVRQIPQVEAICAWDGSLTYLELDHLADLAAQRLVKAGVRPGVFVPFAFEKSMWAVVATLAILKAGGAFVPVNPNDPVSRLGEILGKVSAIVVVTMEKFVPIFGPLVENVIVISNKDAEVDHSHIIAVNGGSIQKETKNGLTKMKKASHQAYSNGTHLHPVEPGEAKPTDPIVVLFTSGSTGQPKGIVLEHRAICTHAMVHGSKMRYHNARVLQFAAHTFDVAIMDYFTTLLFSGCICIPSEEERKSDIIGVINRMKADYALLTPSFAGLIDPSEVPTMKTLAIGGEALPQDRVQRWSECVDLIQVYGPAEVGICLTMNMKIDTAPETVGFPLRNSSCWLVDPDDHDVLVPIGTVGELMIGGPSLARGYLNDEAKTRKSFIDKPKWAAELGLPCERFYLSGDLLRYNTSSFDGSYDIIGRKDAQIKLRGQRIEPAEIEYHVGKITGVAVSMVTRSVKGSLADQLVCILQMRDHDSKSSRVRDEPIRLAKSQVLTAKRLRDELVQVLPLYMIPSTCLTVDTIPLVPSLKIDRRRVNSWLSSLETDTISGETNQLSPLSPNETTALTLSQKISSIVAKKDTKRRSTLDGKDFGLQAVGINSIQIISLSMYLQREHSAKISMETLLASDLTIRKLAKMVEGLVSSNTELNNGVYPGVASLGLMSPHVDLAQEAQTLTQELFRSFSPPSTTTPESQKQERFNGNIFLTGATGYLGSIILQHLLRSPHYEVFALVRCSSPVEGMQRIIASATKYKWWHHSYTKRIHVWPGDLTKPNLDLEPAHLHLLSGSTAPTFASSSIHSVIHNGARVHYSSSYSTLSPTNITPTLSLLRLTAHSPYISTFVFVSGGLKPNTSLSNTSPPQAAKMANSAGGYAQTKYVSSALVSACATHPSFHSKSLQIVNPGYIMGSPSTAGVANTTDFIWRLVAGCVETGAFNADEADHWLFIADVEEVADVVISGIISRNEDGFNDGKSGRGGNNVKPTLTGIRFSSLWDILRSKFAYELRPLPHEEWLSRLKAKVMDKGDEHLLFPLLHVLERDGGMIGEEISQVGGVKGEYDGYESGKDHEERVLKAVEANVRFLIGVGMLPAAELVVEQAKSESMVEDT